MSNAHEGPTDDNIMLAKGKKTQRELEESPAPSGIGGGLVVGQATTRDAGNEHCENSESAEETNATTNSSKTAPLPLSGEMIRCLLCERKVCLERMYEHVSDHVHLITKPYRCQVCEFYTSDTGSLLRHSQEKMHQPVKLTPRRKFKYAEILGNTVLNDSLLAARKGSSDSVLAFRSSVNSAEPEENTASEADEQERRPKRNRASREEEDGEGKRDKMSPEDLPAVPVKRRRCQKCGERVPERRGDLYRHIADGHKERITFACPVCGKKLRGFLSLKQHSGDEHQNENISILTLKELDIIRKKMNRCFPNRAARKAQRKESPAPPKDVCPAEKKGLACGGSLNGMEDEEKRKPPSPPDPSLLPSTSSRLPDSGSALVDESVSCEMCKMVVPKTVDAQRLHISEHHNGPEKPRGLGMMLYHHLLLRCFPSNSKCSICKTSIGSFNGRRTHAALKHLRIPFQCSDPGCQHQEFLPESLYVHRRKAHPRVQFSKILPSDDWKNKLSDQVKVCFPGFFPPREGLGDTEGERGVGKSSTVVPAAPPQLEKKEEHSTTHQKTSSVSKENGGGDGGDDEIMFVMEVPPREKASQLPPQKRKARDISSGVSQPRSNAEASQSSLVEGGRSDGSLASKVLADTMARSFGGTQPGPSSESSSGVLPAPVKVKVERRKQTAVKTIQRPVQPKKNQAGHGTPNISAECPSSDVSPCGLCGVKFQKTNKAGMEKHVWLAHVSLEGNPKKAPYGCKKCSFNSFVVERVRMHWKHVHDLPIRDCEFRRIAKPEHFQIYEKSCLACFNTVFC